MSSGNAVDDGVVALSTRTGNTVIPRRMAVATSSRTKSVGSSSRLPPCPSSIVSQSRPINTTHASHSVKAFSMSVTNSWPGAIVSMSMKTRLAPKRSASRS